MHVHGNGVWRFWVRVAIAGNKTNFFSAWKTMGPRGRWVNLGTSCLRWNELTTTGLSEVITLYRCFEFVYSCTFEAENMASICKIGRQWTNRVRQGLHLYNIFPHCPWNSIGKQASSMAPGVRLASPNKFAGDAILGPLLSVLCNLQQRNRPSRRKWNR